MIKKEGKYRIEIDYRTSDLMNLRNEKEFLILTWDNLNIAKCNLNNIKEHYQFYELYNDSYKKNINKEKIYLEYKDKEWFVEKEDNYYNGNCMKLFLDDGNMIGIYCFWCGCFKYLYGAKIIIYNDIDIGFSTSK